MKRRTIIIVGIILAIICFSVTTAFGKTYVFQDDVSRYSNNADDYTVEMDSGEQFMKITDKRVENGVLSLTLISENKGHEYLSVFYGGERICYERFCINSFGTISRDHIMGDSTGDIVIPCAAIIFLALLLYYLIQRYRASINEDLYQYKNIMLLGLIVFIAFLILLQIMMLFSYHGLIDSIKRLEASTSTFSTLTLPVFFIVSVLVTISSINLIRREGFSLKNMLGIFFGLILVITPFIPDLVYWYLLKHHFDVGNLNRAPTYIEEFASQMVYTAAAYLECMLIGTIVVAYRAAKRIPSFDKDYILILGCMIKKDGTLTNLLKGRADRAVEFAEMQKSATGKDIIFVPSGGQGNDEVISEGLAIKNYLLSIGIKEESIMAECESANTYENFRNSAGLIRERSGGAARIAFSTTNYHVFRSGFLASKQGIRTEGIGSKTKSYFWVNAFVREFIAMLHSEKKKHAAAMMILALLWALMVVMWYLANNI